MTDCQMLLSVDPSTTRTGWALFPLPDRLPRAYGALDRDQRLSGVRAGVDIATRLVRALPVLWSQQYGLRVMPDALTVVVEVPGPAHIARLAKTRGGVGGALDVATTAGVIVGMVQVAWPGVGTVLVPADQWNPGQRGSTREGIAERIAAQVKGYSVRGDKGLDVAMAIAMGQWYVDRATERRTACPR